MHIRLKAQPSISLITCTNSKIKILRLIESLKRQNVKINLYVLNFSRLNFEIRHLSSKNLKIQLVKKTKYSLSKARNFFLSKIKSNIVGFPDDDCLYPRGLLRDVIRNYDNRQKKCIGCCYKFHGGPLKNKKKVFQKDIFGNCISFNFFLFNKKGLRFNESLGLGAKYNFGEESELLLRQLKDGHYLQKNNKLSIYHPKPIKEKFHHYFSQGLGIIGFLKTCKRKKLKLSYLAKLKLLTGSFIKMLYYFATNKRRLFINNLGICAGKLSGFINHYEYKP